MRTWIIDDEGLARERLRRFLSRCPEIDLIGEFASASTALPQLEVAQPDLVFLDIEMPGLNGLEFASVLCTSRQPAVVFVTAHEAFAVSAFAVDAVDYLLKPFDGERLSQAVSRARQWISRRRQAPVNPESPPQRGEANQARLAVRVDGRVVVLRLEEIEWIEAANNYVTLHLVTGKRLMMRTTLSSLEARLPKSIFVRVNRSAMANLQHVATIRPTNYGDHEMVLNRGTTLWISRARRSEVAQQVRGEVSA